MKTLGNSECYCTNQQGVRREHPPQFEVLVDGELRVFYPHGGCHWEWATRTFDGRPVRWRQSDYVTREWWP